MRNERVDVRISIPPQARQQARQRRDDDFDRNSRAENDPTKEFRMYWEKKP